jgi:RNA polymerase sigma factor (sigma-70 family)
VAVAHGTLTRFKSGDGVAFAEIVRAYAPLLRSVTARYWRRPFEQEEAMQEIWMQIHRNRDALDLSRADAFTGWLATIARRRCIDLLRQSVAPADDTEAAAVEWLITAPEQEQTAENEELRRAVDDFSSRLDPRWRDFFRLHFVEGVDYEGTAARLGISKLRCKYMRKVLAARAARNRELMAALGREVERAR